MCTHLHFDHVGWNTRLENGQWVPTFANATYLFGKRDYDYFKANPEGEELHHEAFLDSIAPVMDAGKAELVDEDHVAHREIHDGIWLEPAFGHSPGCCTINAEAGGPPALFWGDVIHHPVQLIRHDLKFAFDADGAQASKTRVRTMQRAADEELLCFPAHFRRTSAGHVKRDGDAFRYEWIEAQ
jgi:glyoxylase-like metal-dependent hydrolase (beta-lactamase superfamily II)